MNWNIIFSFTPLLVIAAIVALIVAGVRNRDDNDEPGIGTIRRLLGYGASLAGLALAAAGGSLLMRMVLRAITGGGDGVDDAVFVALGLSFVVVGTPVWIGAWLVMERVARSHPVELRTLSRKAYLHIVLGGSALAAVISAVGFLSTLGRVGAFDETMLSVAVFMSIVWLYHWRLQEREGELTDLTMSVRRFYVYALSLVGVLLLVIGLGTLLTLLMSGAYDALFRGRDLLTGSWSPWTAATQASLAQLVVGSVVAWWHWIRVASNDAGSTLRSIYLYPIAILGGAVAVVVASSVGLYHLLQWWMGDPFTSAAVDHFDIFPGLIATGIVGAAVWLYHWQVARDEAAADQEATGTATRIYNYMVSALGMGTLAVGIVMLFGLLLGLLSPSGEPSLRGDLWRNPLVLAITLLAVGVPAWLWHWRRVQFDAARLGAAERDAVARRVFIYGTFGVALVASLVTLSITLFNVFELILGEREAGRLLWDSRWPIAVLLTAGVSTAYFWQVLREDRAVIGAAEPPQAEPTGRKRVSVLAPASGVELVARIESTLGYRVTALWAEGGLEAAVLPGNEEITRALGEVGMADSDHVMVIVDGETLRVVPYVSQAERTKG